MLIKIGGLARAIAILLAIVAAFVPIGGMNVPLVLLVLGLVAGLALTDERMVVNVALVIALLGPWVWHWGPVVRTSAEAGPYRREPAFETVRITPGVVRAFRDLPGPAPVVLGDPQRLFELFAFADIRAAVLPEARTRAVPKLDEASRNHLGQTFFSLETTNARRNQILHRLHVGYVLLDLRDQPPDVLRRIMADPALVSVYRDPPDVPDHLGRFEILRVKDATADRSAAGRPAGSSTA